MPATKGALFVMTLLLIVGVAMVAAGITKRSKKIIEAFK